FGTRLQRPDEIRRVAQHRPLAQYRSVRWYVGGPSGCGHVRWWARLTCHLVYLRLTTRGFERARLAGRMRPASWRRNVSHALCARRGWSGGKSVAMGDGAADGTYRRGETDAVGVAAGVFGGVGHQGADREVTAQMAPEFLFDQVGRFGPQHHARPALVGFQFVEGQLDFPTGRVCLGEFGRGDFLG